MGNTLRYLRFEKYEHKEKKLSKTSNSNQKKQKLSQKNYIKPHLGQLNVAFVSYSKQLR